MGYINTKVKMPSIGDTIKQEDLDALATQLGHEIFPIKQVILNIYQSNNTLDKKLGDNIIRKVQPNDYNVFHPNSTLYLRNDKYLWLYIKDEDFCRAYEYSYGSLYVQFYYNSDSLPREYGNWPIYEDYIDMNTRTVAIYVRIPDYVNLTSTFINLEISTGNGGYLEE